MTALQGLGILYMVQSCTFSSSDDVALFAQILHRCYLNQVESFADQYRAWCPRSAVLVLKAPGGPLRVSNIAFLLSIMCLHTYVYIYTCLLPGLATSGKPSTWLPLGRLVEQA